MKSHNELETIIDDSIIAQKPEQGEGKFDQCCQWLQDFLSNGAVLQSETKEHGAEMGYSKATLYRAKNSTGIKSRKRHDGLWEWFIPEGTQDYVSQDTQGYRENLEYLRHDPVNSSVSASATCQGSQGSQVPCLENLREFDPFSDSVSGGNFPCCVSCRRTERPCQQYVSSPAGCENHFAKEGEF